MKDDHEAGASSDVQQFLPITIAEGETAGTASFAPNSDVHLTFASACVWVPTGQSACVYIDGGSGLIPIVVHRQGNFGIYDRFAGTQVMNVTVNQSSTVILNKTGTVGIARAQVQLVGQLTPSVSTRAIESETQDGEARGRIRNKNRPKSSAEGNVHESIRMAFKLEERRYEAVGFLREGENSVGGREMLRRVVGENGGAIGKDDEEFIWEWRGQLARELQPYYLVTARHQPARPGLVSSLSYLDEIDGWQREWRNVNVEQWDENYLVVRRVG